MADQRGLCCSVCYNNFKSDEDQYVPRNLTCGHTYCTGCLTKLACQAWNPGTLSCPTCKMETTLCQRFDGVRALPKNFGVLEILGANEEVQADSIQSEKEKNKYLCPEHDEPLKVYCHTDNCLICIYCQVYGKHVGHTCELATNIASSTREELRSLSKKLGDYYDIVKNAKTKVIDAKDAILNTKQYLRNRITKHMGMLRTCMARRETMLKCEVDSKTSEKLRPMDAQESVMTEIMNKCDRAYSLIQKCQSNDTALVEEKNNIYGLADEVSSLMEKCELEPKACDNLTYYFEYDIARTLETKIGEIRMLKPGQKEEPFAGLYAHELSGKKETKEACSQTENWENNHPMFESLLHGLEEIVHTGLTAQSWEDRTALELGETESSLSSDEPGEPISLNHSIDDNTDDHHDDEDDGGDEIDDDAAAAGCNDDDVQSEWGVGGEVLQTVRGAQRQSSSQSSEEETLHQPDESSLLNELQKEIERLRLLGPRGEVVSLTDETSMDTGTDSVEADRDRVLLSSPDQQGTGQQPFSLVSSLPLRGQRLVTTDGLSLDSRRSTRQKIVRCSAVNCKSPVASASRRCRHCKRVYCSHCAPLSLCCHKNLGGHLFVSTEVAAARSRRGRGDKKASSAIFRKKPNVAEGTPWQCKHCTMLNGAQVLVCLGCDTLRDSDARDGRNVCPMCTLVNEPGKSKCELCDTDLVSHQAAHASQAD